MSERAGEGMRWDRDDESGESPVSCYEAAQPIWAKAVPILMEVTALSLRLAGEILVFAVGAVFAVLELYCVASLAADVFDDE